MRIFPPPNFFQMNFYFYLAKIYNICSIIKVGSSVFHLWGESASQRLINDVDFIMIIWIFLTKEQITGYISFTRRPTSWRHSRSKKNVLKAKFKFILKKLTSPVVFSKPIVLPRSQSFCPQHPPSLPPHRLLHSVWCFAAPGAIARQAPLSMGFPGQEYRSGLPFLPPGDLPYPGIELTSLESPASQGGFFTTWKVLIILHNPPTVVLFWSHLPTLGWTY